MRYKNGSHYGQMNNETITKKGNTFRNANAQQA